MRRLYNEYDVNILAAPDQPAITSCYGVDHGVNLNFTTGGANYCYLYYDKISRLPYSGTGADQGDSPIYMPGNVHSINLTGLNNGLLIIFQ